MVTVAQFRKAALALPDVEEKSHFGQPDFRVANKIFADLGREGGRATLKLTIESQAQLLEARPEAFSPAPGQWGSAGWTYIVLDAIRAGDLRELLLGAWGQVARNGAGGATTGVKRAAPKKKTTRPRL
jgi:hypothetical protein